MDLGILWPALNVPTFLDSGPAVSEDVFSEGGWLTRAPLLDVRWDILEVKPLFFCTFLPCPVSSRSSGSL